MTVVASSDNPASIWTAGSRLFIAQVSEALGPLARSVAMAHLLLPAEFGIALSISITAGLAEMILDFGIDRSAVRMAGSDDDAQILNTLHTLAVLRGTIASILIWLGGSYLA